MTRQFAWSWSYLKSDIRFWLVIFFLLRLIGITNPPLEISHSWRQSLTAMIAQNFLEHGPQLFYPRVDIGGIREGIIGSEFPLFNYLIYLCSKVFGYQHWFGRLINLFVTSIGVFYFYKGLKRVNTERLAFFSSLILAVSVWFGFGRKIMPDTFSVALVVIGLYHAVVYLQEGRIWSLVGYFIFCALGIMCKIPALSLFAVLGVVLIMPSINGQRKIVVFIVGCLSVLPALWWYFVWVPHLVSTYQYQLYFPRSLSEGWRELVPLWSATFEKFYFVALSSFLAFGAFLGGVVVLIRNFVAYKWVIVAISLVSVVFGIFILKTGFVFPTHSYYVVPYVPVMALGAGVFLSHIRPKYASILCTLLCIEAIANQQDDMFLKEREMYKLSLTELTDKYVPKDSLVIINSSANPQQMYFANRVGWPEDSETLIQGRYIDSLNQLGASYLIWDKHQGKFPEKGMVIYEGEHYIVSKLTGKR